MSSEATPNASHSSSRNNRPRPRPSPLPTEADRGTTDEVPSPFGSPPQYSEQARSISGTGSPRNRDLDAAARALFFAYQLGMADRTNNRSSSGDDRNQNITYRINVRAGVEVRGHGSIVGTGPGNAGQITHGTIRDVATSEHMRTQAGDRNPRNYEINIEAGVTIVGNQNVVGHGLQDVARRNQQGQVGQQGNGQGAVAGGNQQQGGGQGAAAGGGGARRNN
ncbi:hypothetical protein BDV96DRAFT_684932 [Lophiotrema nucula]|uniref:Uncharacterized protein n=1 Tax=Lophiotrema nucula TaxID=690887 RepID=A0A6A5ZFM5_9PLEO|nr:hypothetical protein BDV96DRAFT_684932 [Lophiotrema nucula]